MEQTQAEWAVLGDGWAALATVAQLVQKGKKVAWIAGSGGRAFAPLPLFHASSRSSLNYWKSLCESFDVEAGEVQEGFFVREYKKSSFHSPEKLFADEQKWKEQYWEVERFFLPREHIRLSKDLFSQETALRNKLVEHESVMRREGVPVNKMIPPTDETNGFQLELASGETLHVSRLVHADRWKSFRSIEGLEGVKRENPRISSEGIGILQVYLSHPSCLEPGMNEVFCLLPNKDPNEKKRRYILGYFSEEGNQSVWSLLISPEEAENNHELAKRIRKVKQTLSRAFEGFSIHKETVRFREEALFETEDEVPNLPFVWNHILFLGDGLGMNHALDQVQKVFDSSDEKTMDGDFGFLDKTHANE